MNNVVAFVGTFVISFIIATGGVYFMNNQFYNIWDFDFRSLNQVLEEQKAAEETAAVDSVKTVDHEEENVTEQPSATEEHTENKTIEKTGKTSKSNNTHIPKPSVEKPKSQPAQVKEETNEPEVTVDSSYTQWAKQTAKIYESMDAASAAKIIQNYSDNVARDIIYSMNKKKAAGILAVLDPKVATRITRAN